MVWNVCITVVFETVCGRIECVVEKHTVLLMFLSNVISYWQRNWRLMPLVSIAVKLNESTD